MHLSPLFRSLVPDKDRNPNGRRMIEHAVRIDADHRLGHTFRRVNTLAVDRRVVHDFALDHLLRAEDGLDDRLHDRLHEE